MPLTRYFYDFEFLEDGVTIDPISIGIVADDGREYYAVNRDADWDRVINHQWLPDNVLPYIPGGMVMSDSPANVSGSDEMWRPDINDTRVKPREMIATEVAAFLTANSTDWHDNELWAYYAAYDHVALCQLWGPMMKLPAGVPMWTNDLQQEAARLERLLGADIEKPEQAAEHHALADAWWNAALWDIMRRVSATL